jgi:hypothetical protein
VTTMWTEETDYADEHENGQLRLGVIGEQRPLLPLPDVPTCDCGRLLVELRVAGMRELHCPQHGCRRYGPVEGVRFDG